MSTTLPQPSLDEIDLIDPHFWAQPQEARAAAFRLLREQQPLASFDEPEVPGQPRGPGFYAVTRYADAVEISKNPELFGSAEGSTTIPDMQPEFAELFGGSMITADDPRHARLRRIVSRRFSERGVQRLLDRVAQTADEVIDAVAGRGEADFVADVAAPLPLLVICDLMGIPRSRYPEVSRHSNTIIAQGDPDSYPPGADHAQILTEAAMGLLGLMGELAQHRQRQPTDDLTSALVHSDAGGEHLTVGELGSFFMLLVIAGNETTRTALSHGMVVFMRRTATRDGELAGVPFRAGDKFVLLYPSANRDETVFADPEAFDVAREPNPHVGFGARPALLPRRAARPPRDDGDAHQAVAPPARHRDHRRAAAAAHRRPTAGRRDQTPASALHPAAADQRRGDAMTEDIAARVVSRHRRSPRRQQPRAGRRGTQLARRGGTALAVIATLTCGITTLLLASGLVAAGGGLLGSGELAVLAAVVPVTVLIWRATVRRRRRCAHAPYPAGQRTTKEASP